MLAVDRNSRLVEPSFLIPYDSRAGRSISKGVGCARLLTLVFANRGGAIRVIPGWDSTAEEEGEYWKGV